MTTAAWTWTVSSYADAARVRTALAGLAAAAGAPTPERSRCVTDLSAHLRHCLEQGGAWRADLRTEQTGDGALVHIGVDRAGPRRAADDAAWHRTLACPHLPGSAGAHPDHMAEADLAQALLDADTATAELLDELAATHRLVDIHREELHQTNQGIVALHAELETASQTQLELLEAERSARAEAEDARRLLTFLAEASADVTASLNQDDIVARLSRLLVPRYAGEVDVWLFSDDEPAAHGGQHSAAAAAAARTGRPQHAAAHPGGLRGVDDLPPSRLSPDQPLLSIPLTGNGPVGVLTLTAPGRPFDPDETVMLVELARRTGTALGNARRYAQHRDVAEALQRAQLTDLPATPGLRLAARYLPATRSLNIGGDWYDAFLQPDGSLLAVVGDVTGHGLHAAVTMGQLRTALRAYAVEGDTPAQILTRMHRLLHHQHPDLYATAVIARFRPGDPTVVWAAAGHPPPILCGPAGDVRVLDAKPGIMLGVPVPYIHHDQTVHLEPGGTLALYTDGLVERRAQGIDPGITRLAKALSELGPELERDLDTAAEALLEPMLRDSHGDDDVCLLLCHPTATAADRPSAGRGTGAGSPSQ